MRRKFRKRERNIVRSTLADSRTAFEKGKKISYLVGKLATGIMEPLGSRGGTGCPLIRSTIEDSIRRYWGGRWGEGARERIERERERVSVNSDTGYPLRILGQNSALSIFANATLTLARSTPLSPINPASVSLSSVHRYRVFVGMFDVQGTNRPVNAYRPRPKLIVIHARLLSHHGFFFSSDHPLGFPDAQEKITGREGGRAAAAFSCAVPEGNERSVTLHSRVITMLSIIRRDPRGEGLIWKSSKCFRMIFR